VSTRSVAVLAGGLSHEREVSLRSGRRLAAALRGAGLSVVEWDADASLIHRLRTDRPDAVAIALHGGEGENGSVQAVLDLLDVPFVGTPSAACRRAWDKPTAKAELARAGLDTPEWIALPHITFRELGAQAVLDAATIARLEESAVAAHRLLGLRDVSRTDAVVDADGRVQILEVNVSPGLTDTSLLPIAVTASGADLGKLYAGLVERAVSRGTSA